MAKKYQIINGSFAEGGVNSEEVKQIVDEYLKDNSFDITNEVIEGDNRPVSSSAVHEIIDKTSEELKTYVREQVSDTSGITDYGEI